MAIRGIALFALLVATPWAQCVEIDFTLTGHVTSSSIPSSIQVGNLAVIRYTAGTEDYSPDPTLGLYACSTATITIGSTVLNSPGASDRAIRVNTNPLSLQSVKYDDRVSGDLYFMAGISGPNGLLSSDGLPLDLELGASSPFFFFRAPGFSVNGRLDTYQGRIPEPTCIWASAIGGLVRRRRQ